MQKKVWYYEKWVGRHASFPPRLSIKGIWIIATYLDLTSNIVFSYVILTDRLRANSCVATVTFFQVAFEKKYF